MTYEIRHIQKRRKERLFEKETSSLKILLDKLAYPIAALVPLSSLDQALRIWKEQSALGVSMIVWLMLFATSIFWIFYGAIHREKAIFFGHIIWLAVSSVILFEIFIFQ